MPMIQFHAAAAGRYFSWRFAFLAFIPHALALGLCAILGLPTIASASVLASDSFETYSTGAIAGKNGGTGWSGAWTAPGSTAIRADVVDTTSNPLISAIPGIATINGATRALELALTNGSVNQLCGVRPLAAPLAQTFYVGYLVRYVGSGTWAGANNTFTLHLGTDSSSTTTLNFGLRGGAANEFIMRHGTGAPVAGSDTGGELANNTTYYLVCKMNWSGSAFTSANMWLNPGLNDNVDTPNGDALLSGFSSAQITHVFFRQAVLDADDVLRADELKIGTQWSDMVQPAYPPPSITLHPRSRTNCAGTAAVFTAAATGTPTPTVQWQVSTNAGGAWANVGGAVSTTYSPASVMGNNGNLYRAVFTNAGGSTNSSAAMLTVNSAPTAVNFSVNAAPNQPRVIDIAGLLAACTAPDGDAFYLSAVAPLSTNGAPVAITATNTIVYRPPTGFTGADRFNYTITDKLGCSATAAVQMTVGP